MDKTGGFFLIIILSMVMFWVAFNPNLTDILASKKAENSSAAADINTVEKGSIITGTLPADGSKLTSGTKAKQPVRYWFVKK